MVNHVKSLLLVWCQLYPIVLFGDALCWPAKLCCTHDSSNGNTPLAQGHDRCDVASIFGETTEAPTDLERWMMIFQPHWCSLFTNHGWYDGTWSNNPQNSKQHLATSITLWPSLANISWVSIPLKLSWTDWFVTVEMYSPTAKRRAHLHGWQVRNSVRAASTLTCMGTSGTPAIRLAERERETPYQRLKYPKFQWRSPDPSNKMWTKKHPKTSKNSKKFCHPCSIFVWYPWTTT